MTPIGIRDGVALLLDRNPTIANRDIAGVLAANLHDFHGSVSISEKMHTFSTGQKQARHVYVSPYTYYYDIFTTIKRIFLGITFPPLQGDNIYTTLSQGRRFVVIISNDLQDVDTTFEQDSAACWLIGYIQRFSAWLGLSCCQS